MSAKKIVFMILEIVFTLVVPAALVIWNYSTWGEEANAFKISFTGILILIVLFFLFKYVFLNKWMRRMRDKATQHEADLKIETDEEKIENLKSELKKERTIEAVLNYILPILVCLAIVIIAECLESAMVTLSGTFAWCTVSILIGGIFSVLFAREVD